MEPIDLEQKDGHYILVHKCQKCGFIRRNKVCPDDDFEAVLTLARHKTQALKG
jgi:hypothetical protein